MASAVVEEAAKQIIREFGEEIAEAGVKKVVESGAKEAGKKIVSGGIKGAASGALEAGLTALGKQAISKEAAKRVAEEVFGSLATTTTNKLLTKGSSVVAQQATEQAIAQLMNSGGKSMTEAVGKILIVNGGKGLGKDIILKTGGKSLAEQVGKNIVIFTRVGVIFEGVFFSISLVNELRKYKKGKSGEQVAIDTASNAAGTVASMVGAGIGQALIPIPVLGAIVGGAVGSTAVSIFTHLVT